MNNRIGFLTFLKKENSRFFKVWKQTLVSPVISNLLYFVVFAPIFANLEVVGDIKYLTFIAPGLIMMGMINSAFQNAASSIIIARYTGNLEEILTYPLSSFETTAAYTLSATLRGLLVGAMTLLVVVFFVPISFTSVGFILLASVLVNIFFGVLGLLIGIWSQDFDKMSTIMNFVLTPLEFLGGVFFAVSQLPPLWQKLSFFNPITHMIDLFRYGLIGYADYNPWTNLIFLLVVTIVCFVITERLMARGYKLKK